MANGNENRPSIYYIPENFLGESRILNGQIRTRYLIDSIALSIIFAAVIALPLLLFVLNDASFNVKVTLLVIIIAPGFLAGQIGYNGDPISVFLINFFKWRKQRQVRIYNENPRMLGTDPVKALYEQNKGMDKIVSFVQTTQQKRIDKKNAEQYVEGETFEFQYDPGIDNYLEDTGDYSDEATGDENSWPTSNVSISSGSDLDGLESLLSDDWYSDLNQSEGFDFEAYDGSEEQTEGGVE